MKQMRVETIQTYHYKREDITFDTNTNPTKTSEKRGKTRVLLKD